MKLSENMISADDKTILLRPTPSYQSDNSRPEEEDILPDLRSGLITVTHSVFTITREQQGEIEPGFTYFITMKLSTNESSVMSELDQ